MGFVDRLHITESSGVAFTHAVTESGCWGDYDYDRHSDRDSDGDSDIYLSHSTGPNTLMCNDGGGAFTDVSNVAGVDRDGFGVGCAFGDLDNDFLLGDFGTARRDAIGAVVFVKTTDPGEGDDDFIKGDQGNDFLFGGHGVVGGGGGGGVVELRECLWTRVLCPSWFRRWTCRVQSAPYWM